LGFEEKEIKFIIHERKRRTGRVPLPREECLPFTGHSGAQLDCVTRCMLTMAAGLRLQVSCATSLKLYVLEGRFTALAVSKR
jgi:hypothetical protein